MDAFLVKGPCQLKGEVSIFGAKNAALPILFASLMCKGNVELDNVPKVQDVLTTQSLFKQMGISSRFSKGVFEFNPNTLSHVMAPYELVKQMRASILCLGPLLTRYGEARVSFPGGCTIGSRPINWHLDGLAKLGAHIDVKDGYVFAKASRLHGGTYRFPRKTVTGTANVLCAAVLATGQTILDNVAREPEVIDLCRFLIHQGAKIKGVGSSKLTIRGVSSLDAKPYRIMDDRLEWGTYAIACAATGGEVRLKSTLERPYVSLLSAKLRQAGVKINVQTDEGLVTIKGCPTIKSVDITTRAYPGFPTDLQAPWMVLMTQAKGVSCVTEHIFENRFMHVAELNRLGAHIDVHGPRVAAVRGGVPLTGAEIMASDIRAGAALVIAALCAEGETQIRRVYHIDRGYVAMEKKLEQLGATIERVEAPI